MSEMVDKVAKAIAEVQVFVRFNDWTPDRVVGSPIEVCRYGRDGEDEIVVIKRFAAAKKEDVALNEVISEQRARAAIEAMREPSEAVLQAGYDAEAYYISASTWRYMIDASLKDAAT